MTARKITLLPLFAFFLSVSLYSQIEFKLQLLDENKWGIFVKANGDNPTANTITASGQLTAVLPNGYNYNSVTSINGFWMNNATVEAPIENTTATYASFGLIQAEPSFPIPFSANEETLLVTFEGDGTCPDFMQLIDCGVPNSVDPFCPNNSINTNPGNDLSVVDMGTTPVSFYFFTDLYAPAAWDCHDNDSDGLLNAFEDTNGNGIYDPGIDASDLNDPNIDSPGPEFEVAESESLTIKKNINTTDVQKTIEAPFTAPIFSYSNKYGQTFTLSPNPAHDYLYIGFNQTRPVQKADFSLINSQGIMLKSFEINNTGRQSIHVSDLPPGVYFLLVKHEDGTTAQKRFVKQ